MAVVYLPAAKFRNLYTLSAIVWAILAIAEPRSAPLGLMGLIVSLHRAALHSQRIELTPVGLICRTPFGERRLPYRMIGAMRFSRFTGDLLLELPRMQVRIPRHFDDADEIRRAVSLAVWAHRGGDVPPDLAEPDSAFG